MLKSILPSWDNPADNIHTQGMTQRSHTHTHIHTLILRGKDLRSENFLKTWKHVQQKTRKESC